MGCGDDKCQWVDGEGSEMRVGDRRGKVEKYVQ